MLKITLLSYLIVVSETFVIEKGDKKIFYEVDNLRNTVVRPDDIQLIDDERHMEQMNKYMYESLSPQEGHGVNKDEFKDYVIIKAKRQLFNIGPYVMMRQLDDIKYMVVWMNLYCEMHPDCNKSTLNEELNKIVYAVEKQ